MFIPVDISHVAAVIRGVTFLSNRRFRNEKETGAEIRPAIVSGFVTGDAQVSYWLILSLP